MLLLGDIVFLRNIRLFPPKFCPELSEILIFVQTFNFRNCECCPKYLSALKLTTPKKMKVCETISKNQCENVSVSVCPYLVSLLRNIIDIYLRRIAFCWLWNVKLLFFWFESRCFSGIGLAGHSSLSYILGTNRNDSSSSSSMKK